MLPPNIGVSCAALSQRLIHGAAGEAAVRDEGRLQSYILEGVLPVLSTAFQDCSRSLVCRATGLLSCYYPSVISYCIYITLVFRLYAVSFHHSTVFKELLDNPFSVRPKYTIKYEH
jgi:hypothetical protein